MKPVTPTEDQEKIERAAHLRQLLETAQSQVDAKRQMIAELQKQPLAGENAFMDASPHLLAITVAEMREAMGITQAWRFPDRPAHHAKEDDNNRIVVAESGDLIAAWIDDIGAVEREVRKFRQFVDRLA